MDASSESQENTNKTVTVDLNTFIESSKNIEKTLSGVMEHYKSFLDANNYKNRTNYLEIAKDIEKICENDEMYNSYKYLK